ncbi:MAG TPA: PRC-barrel domain-containing protein [Acetobacteraceae bacterium]|nr:PRC-barrel domain-containing protein [Acetobacteraceae bacterium]
MTRAIALLVNFIVWPIVLGGPPAAWAQAQAPVKPPSPPPAKVEHVRKARAESILGEPVRDAKGSKIGHIVDVLIDRRGRLNAAVIEFEGFFGVGNRKIAVAWRALHFAVVKDRIVISLGLDAARIKAMPEYKTSAKVVPVATPAKPAPPSAAKAP